MLWTIFVIFRCMARGTRGVSHRGMVHPLTSRHRIGSPYFAACFRSERTDHVSGEAHHRVSPAMH